MPKSRPQIYDFLNSLTERLDYIGKPDLASQIRAAYKNRRGAVDMEKVLDLLTNELDDVQLQLPFPLAA